MKAVHSVFVFALFVIFASTVSAKIYKWVDEDGKVLFSKMGVDVLILKSGNLDLKLGGDIVLDYLVKYNMFSSNNKAIEIFN